MPNLVHMLQVLVVDLNHLSSIVHKRNKCFLCWHLLQSHLRRAFLAYCNPMRQITDRCLVHTPLFQEVRQLLRLHTSLLVSALVETHLLMESLGCTINPHGG